MAPNEPVPTELLAMLRQYRSMLIYRVTVVYDGTKMDILQNFVFTNTCVCFYFHEATLSPREISSKLSASGEENPSFSRGDLPRIHRGSPSPDLLLCWLT